LIGQDVGFEDIGIDLPVLFELLRIPDGEFPEGKVLQPDEAFLRNLKILVLECLKPQETKVVIGHAQTGQFVCHRILLPLHVLDQRGRLRDVHHSYRIAFAYEQLEPFKTDDACL